MSEGPNPFAPPKAEWEKNEGPAFSPGGLLDASQGIRFANFVIDNVVRTGMVIAMAVTLGDNAWIGIFFSVGYYIFFEALFARTPAKFVTRTRVVGLDGSKPRFTQILGRNLARFVPFEPFSFLGNVNGWHDRWSDTRVVRDPGRT